MAHKDVMTNRYGGVRRVDVSGMASQHMQVVGPSGVDRGGSMRIMGQHTAYCICRTSDRNRYMLDCKVCGEWFHHDCINMTESDARNNMQYVCTMCDAAGGWGSGGMGDDSSSHSMDMTPVAGTGHTHASTSALKKKHKSKRSSPQSNIDSKNKRKCGECSACRREDDCGDCDFCKDMKKFGGPNKIRQKCRKKQCINLGLLKGGKSCGGVSRGSHHQPQMSSIGGFLDSDVDSPGSLPSSLSSLDRAPLTPPPPPLPTAALGTYTHHLQQHIRISPPVPSTVPTTLQPSPTPDITQQHTSRPIGRGRRSNTAAVADGKKSSPARKKVVTAGADVPSEPRCQSPLVSVAAGPPGSRVITPDLGCGLPSDEDELPEALMGAVEAEISGGKHPQTPATTATANALTTLPTTVTRMVAPLVKPPTIVVKPPQQPQTLPTPLHTGPTKSTAVSAVTTATSFPAAAAAGGVQSKVSAVVAAVSGAGGSEGSKAAAAPASGPSQCHGPGCFNVANEPRDANYCSNDCKIKAVLSVSIDLVAPTYEPPYGILDEDHSQQRALLRAVSEEQRTCRETLGLLDYHEYRLKVIMAHARATPMNDSFLEGNNKVTNVRCIGSLLSFHCALCDKQIAGKSVLDHMDNCYAKYEAVLKSDIAACVELRASSRKDYSLLPADTNSPAMTASSSGKGSSSQSNGSVPLASSSQSVAVAIGSEDFPDDIFCPYPDCWKVRYLCAQHYNESKASLQSAGACGCPLSLDHTLNDIQNYCPAPKLYCVEHYGWQRLRKAEIVLHKILCWFRMLELIELERLCRLQMCGQSSLLGRLFHGTVMVDATPAVATTTTTSPTATATSSTAASTATATAHTPTHPPHTLTGSTSTSLPLATGPAAALTTTATQQHNTASSTPI